MTTMLDVLDDPEWEAQLPTVMLAHNLAVRKATNLSPFFLTYLRDPVMLVFQLREMGWPFYVEDWAPDALRRMKAVYAYTADKINGKGNVTRDCIIQHLASTRCSRWERQFMFGLIGSRLSKSKTKRR